MNSKPPVDSDAKVACTILIAILLAFVVILAIATLIVWVGAG